MYKKYRYKDTDVHVYLQEYETPRLLQYDKKIALSKFIYKGKKPKVIINCSYFSKDYVNGRNQGDIFNDTINDNNYGKFIDLVLLKDGTYECKPMYSWEYADRNKILCGFSVATMLIQNGKDVELYSSANCNIGKITRRDPQSAIAILEDGCIVLIVSEGRNHDDSGLNGYQLRNFVRLNFPNVKLLCQLDGGGSSEMIVDGEIKSHLSDGHERLMFNGLAFIEMEESAKTEDNEFIKQDLAYESKYNIKCPYEMKPTYITIHNTANNASAKNEIAYMKSNDKQVSFHVAVDDVEAIQGIPFNRNAWHCGDGGDGKGNRNSIGIEICYSTDYDTSRHAKAFHNASKVVKQLMKEFNIPIENVVQHNHWNGKDCPHRIRKEGTWEKFLLLCQDKQQPTLKYQIGQKVKYNKVATSAFATTDKTPKVNQGEITKIYSGANYPYLIGNGIGFVNDACIVGLVEETNELSELKKQVKDLTDELTNSNKKVKELEDKIEKIKNILK